MTSIAHALNDYRAIRRRTFVRVRELPAAQRLMLAFAVAAFTGLAAQVRILLPFTPVPVTGQVFAVLVAGVLLGGGYGALSQALYVAVGAAGLPWFAGWTSGGSYLTGVTGGYLVGFILAAAVIGAVVDRVPWARRFWPLFGVMLAGDFIILACGAAWLAVLFGGDWGRALLLGAVPFIGVDAAKAVLAASIASALLPKPGDAARLRGQ